MRTIVVGGSASNVGKTTLAVALTRDATRAGRCIAIKVSVREAPGDVRVLAFRPGDDTGHRKDSSRLLAAGAEAVVWVTVSRDRVRDGIAAGLRHARRYRPDALVIESTSAGIEMHAPSESYFVAGEGAWKPWADLHRARASHVLRSADVLEPIPFAEAQQAVVDACATLGAEPVPLARSLGRTLAANVVAEDDLVPFARSAMDGFALCAADTARAPLALRVIGRVYAGEGGGNLGNGCAVAIATGAMLPAGADAVVPIEDVRVTDDAVAIDAPLACGENVFPPGADAHSGDVLVRAGCSLHAGHLGLLAAAGHSTVGVVRRPRIAIVTSGDELVDAGVRPVPGQIRNSNAPMLAAFATSAGADVVSVVHVPDDRTALRRALDAAIDAADLTVTTGGASVGERDLVKAELLDMGFRLLFDGVAMRPGRPVSFAVRGSQRVAVLPGNPAAAYVTFAELLVPALRRLGGLDSTGLPRAQATLASPVRARAGKTSFVFARVSSEDGLVAQPLPDQCASLTRTGAEANALIRLDPSDRTFACGDVVPIDIVDPTAYREAGESARRVRS